MTYAEQKLKMWRKIAQDNFSECRRLTHELELERDKSRLLANKVQSLIQELQQLKESK